MRSVLLARDLLTAMRTLLPGVGFDEEAMRAACTPELFATAAALDQVRHGTPFREAYRNAAAAVDALEAPDPEAALAAYTVDGFPGRGRPDLLRGALRDARAWCEAS